MKDRKHEMQIEFREKMGLFVDVPLAGGVGKSTDGNTPRRAFENPSEFAAITGVSEDLIVTF